MLKANNRTIFEYIWIGGKGELHSKTRVVNQFFFVDSPQDTKYVPEWNYDGSSTWQADSNKNTEVILKPCYICVDPLRRIERTDCYLVLCETYDVDGNPLSTNSRYNTSKIFNRNPEMEPWFGLEQEYFIDSNKNCANLENGYHYCGTMLNGVQRQIVNEHLAACIKTGLKMSGLNAEVTENQWEFQIGPCVGLETGDQMYIARYLLERIAEKYDCKINYDPKPYKNKNGSGCHTNFSTRDTRKPGGFTVIQNYMENLERRHDAHISVYGKDNHLRLTGLHETSSMEKFTWGVGTRNTSVRIPNQTAKDNCGYFEDRRPASNMDPYVVTSIIFETCCLLD
jgi:glutamine synthetase